MNSFMTKKDYIYKDLKEKIQNGIYDFGDKLKISSLAKDYGVSEIPVREALNLLQSDELIEFRPHVGAIVSTISFKDIQDIFDIRIELEGLATRLAVEYLEEEDFAHLEQNIIESKKANKNIQYDLYEKLNYEFHMTIYNASNNNLLCKNIEDLWANTKRYPSVFEKNMNHIKISIKEHEEILEALKHKDCKKAESLIILHKVRASKEILNVTQSKYYEELRIEQNL